MKPLMFLVPAKHPESDNKQKWLLISHITKKRGYLNLYLSVVCGLRKPIEMDKQRDTHAACI